MRIFWCYILLFYKILLYLIDFVTNIIYNEENKMKKNETQPLNLLMNMKEGQKWKTQIKDRD